MRLFLGVLFLLLTGSAQSFAASDDANWEKLYAEVNTAPQEVLEKAESLVQKFERQGNKEQLLKAIELTIDTLYYLERRFEMGSYAQRGLYLLENQPNHPLRPFFLAQLALVELSNQNAFRGKQYLNQAIKLAEQLEDRERWANVLSIAGHFHYEFGDYNEALAYYLAIQPIFDKSKEANLRSNNLSAIALVYSALGQNQAAADYHKRSLNELDQTLYPLDASITLFNIAVTYRAMGEYKDAESYLNKAIALSKDLNDEIGVAYAKYEQQALAAQRKDYSQALSIIDEILPIFDNSGQINMRVLSLLAKARYKALKKDLSFSYDLNLALEIINNSGSETRLIDYYLASAKAYANVEQFKESNVHYEQWGELILEENKKINDSTIKKFQASFDLKQKENENLLLQNENLKQQAALEKDNYIQWLLILITTTFGAIAAWIFSVLKSQLKLKRQFKQLAMTDELTSLPNRRSISEYLSIKINEFKLVNEPTIVAIFDIDHFKRVNDHFGHDIGDQVLRSVANAITSSLRAHDRVGRIGGEEFLIVLTKTDLNHGEKLFQKIKSALTNLVVEELDTPIKITASMGMTLVNNEDDFLSVYKRADQLLYQAKINGRDRCIIQA